MRVESFKTKEAGILNVITLVLEVLLYQCAKCGKVYRYSQQATGHYMKKHRDEKNE